MVNKGTFLKCDDFLTVGDYLVSENRLYFAIMQNNGQLAVYRGPGPYDNHGLVWGVDASAPVGQFFTIMQSSGQLAVYKGTGPADNHGLLWCSNASAPVGQFFVIIENDGNFTIYRGPDPNDNHGLLWCTGFTDPVLEVTEVSKLEYDLNAAKILQAGPVNLYRQKLINHSNIEQTNTIEGSESVTETSEWSNSLSVKFGLSTTNKLSMGVPGLFSGEGSYTLSAEVNDTYTWNGSTSKTRNVGFSSPVVVPPHSEGIGVVTTTIATVSVPYMLTGIALLKSGTEMPITINGTYNGTNSYDVIITINVWDVDTHETKTIVQNIPNVV
jgi:hypothetical protein